MSQLQPVLSEARVQTLSVQQLSAVYNKRLERWMKISGHTSVARFLRETGGTTWTEFRSDWLTGKVSILASEVPEIDDLLDDAEMDFEAVERAMDDYAILWLATHGELNPVRQVQA